MTHPRMARADLATGAVLFVLAVAVIYGSWTMDRLEIRHINPWSAPGLLPGTLGVALALLSGLLILKAARAGPVPETASEASGDEGPHEPGAVTRLVAAGALCLFFVLGLVGRMPFWLATTIFVFLFIAGFEWPMRRGTGKARVLSLAAALIIAVATGLITAYVFGDIFLVRLP